MKSVLFLTLILVFLLIPCNQSHGQSIAVRSQSTGNWTIPIVPGVASSGGWQDENGVGLAAPSSSQDVFIGNSALPTSGGGIGGAGGGGAGGGSPTGTVTVDLTGLGLGQNLTLGVAGTIDTGILNLLAGADLDIEDSITLSQGMINVNAGSIDATSLILGTGTNVTQASLTTVTVDTVDVSGTYDLGAGSTLRADTLFISSGGTFNNNPSGNFEVMNFEINGNESVTVQNGDSISDSVRLTMGGSLIFTQDPNQLNGLDLDVLDIEAGTNSFIELNFDTSSLLSREANNFSDWVLRLAGNQVDLLNEYLADGRIRNTNVATDFVNNPDLTPIKLAARFDFATGDTFLVAVPEPTSMMLLLALGGVSALRRRRS